MRDNRLERVILIGASTGGPGVVEQIIKALMPMEYSAVIIAQHMASDFLTSFTKRLAQQNGNQVSLMEQNMVVEAGNIYIAQGVVTLKEERGTLVFHLEPPKENRFNPDINSVFSSFAPFAKKYQMLGVILTGIGDDGVQGCKALAQMGAKTLTQTPKSAVVDGMPARARQEVGGIEVSETQEIISKIARFCN